MLRSILQKVDDNVELNKNELKYLLELSDDSDIIKLFQAAYNIKLKEVGKKVYFRGIIEFSNICEKDCFYCGIRKSNANVERFVMSEDEIIKEAKWVYENEYASLVLQSGERSNAKFIDFIERILVKINQVTDSNLRITLSLGEQTAETYQRWLNAGAHRYLLRIETTNKKLYEDLHPDDHDFAQRKQCLALLRKLGYQVGTGVMIGLPGQTTEDLANDVVFFKNNDIDMIGMGPYLPHNDTPMGQKISDFDSYKDQQFKLGLKMIAVTRIHLRDVNIAATTALQALESKGRELGVQAGANVIMPNVTDTKFRTSYQLYDNKPCINENSTLCRGCLEKRIDSIGEVIGLNEWGDSPHFTKKRVD